MRRIVIMVMTILFCHSIALSAEWKSKSGKPIPDGPSIKSAQNFVAQLILTTDETELLRRWQIPSETVDVSTASVVEVNAPISAFIVSGGGTANQKGNCDLAVTFKVYQPDGKIYSDIEEQEVWSGKPVPPVGTIELSVAYVRIIIESHEPPGKYRVEAVVTDKLGIESVFLTNEFTVVVKKQA
jgi:hypothetical protein